MTGLRGNAEGSCLLIRSQIAPTKDKVPNFSNTQLHLQKLPLRQVLSCHFTCKCYGRNWSNSHNSGSSWQWHWEWPGLAVIGGLVLIVYREAKFSLGPVGMLVLIKTRSGSAGAGVTSPTFSPTISSLPQHTQSTTSPGALGQLALTATVIAAKEKAPHCGQLSPPINQSGDLSGEWNF